MQNSASEAPKSAHKLTKFQKIAVGGSGLLMVAFVAFLVFGRKGEDELTFESVKVEPLATFADDVHCVARPKPLAETYLSVQHGGRLEQLTKTAGQAVMKGEILAVVDRTVNAAGLKSALSGYLLAEKDYSRISGLLRGGSVTREEFDGAGSRLEIKRAELELAKQHVEDGVVRVPFDGVVSVVVFKVGDKVPDGGRVAAIDDPRGTQASCRLPAEIASQLPAEQNTLWTVVDAGAKGGWRADAKINVEQPQGGFSGLDREVRVETLLPEAKAAIGKLTDITLTLPEHQHVARLDSMAVVRRDGTPYVLTRDHTGKQYEWVPITVIKQTSQATVAAGVPTDKEILLLRDDLTKIETFVKPRLAAAVTPPKSG